jgi:hypothetical protein
MRLIGTVFYFDEYGEILVSHDDIDLTSLDLIVTIDYLISLGFEVTNGDILSDISDGTMRWHSVY